MRAEASRGQIESTIRSNGSQDDSQRELRNNIGAVLREAEAGATFTITVRGRPVATLGPAHAGRRVDVDRETLRGILATPLDGEAVLADRERAEAPIDDPRAD